ncbi:Hypothetical Protein XCAW_00715 [Xanthomonas citri subsp. citri Aw12879]|nr:Hypothetical Protein XCAW_00715 [Xanthomonas citri subsp. citri Aw12879]
MLPQRATSMKYRVKREKVSMRRGSVDVAFFAMAWLKIDV